MRYLFVLGAGLLAGCVTGPVTTVHREGSSFLDRQSAVAACRSDAYQRFPQSLMLVDDDDDVFDRPRFCRGPMYGIAGGCSRGPWSRSSRRSVDANENLRNMYFGNCLRERGFTLITRPVCDSEADKRAYASQRDAEVPEQSLVCVAGDERLDP